MFRTLYANLLFFLRLFSDSSPRQNSLIVFVCENGASKSVIAAELFNRMATHHGLPFSAVYRGVKPDPEVMKIIQERLFCSAAPPQPVILTPELSRVAHLIVSFTDVPIASLAGGNPLSWTAPSVSADYAYAEQVICRQVRTLVCSMMAERFHTIAS